MSSETYRDYVRREVEAMRDSLRQEIAAVHTASQANMLRLVTIAGEDGRGGKLGELAEDVDSVHASLRSINTEVRLVEREVRGLDKRLFRLGVILGALSILGPASVERLLKVIGW